MPDTLLDSLTLEIPGPGAARRDALSGWEEFLDLALAGELLLSMLLAVLLAASLAYHPRIRGKVSSLRDLDQPKAFLLYALVGSMVAQLVRTWPQMAFVIFGIGGLPRITA